MPVYGSPQSGGVTALNTGDSMNLFNAETVAAGTASIPFARGNGPGSTFMINFAASPTAVVVIQAANNDVEAEYQTIYTSTNLQVDAYTDIGYSDFYRAKRISGSAGGLLTVNVKR